MEVYAPGALEQVREESIRRLDSGGLPVLAERRLAALFGSSAERFTTQLSVSEFALTRSIGLRAVSQVMGTCTYHARLALDRAVPARTVAPGTTHDMKEVAGPWNVSRDRALARMSEEARSCGADAVVGVRIQQTQEHLAEGFDASVECVATGTAVVRPAPARAAPVLTSLSAQDYWKLLQQGFAAVGVVAHTAMIGCVPTEETHDAERPGSTYAAASRSWEVREFSHGLRLVHTSAFAQLRSQAERMGAEGIVGVTIERAQSSGEVRFSTYRDLILVVHAIGTAIVRDRTQPTPGPPPGHPLTITPVRHLDPKGGSDS
jgi:uncharacterized protein YbjQ (UPF0145 family)